jgi:hypothetical protein
LDEIGTKNLAALKLLSESQQLEYDFHFSQAQWDIDAPVLIVSEAKSLLPVYHQTILFSYIMLLYYTSSLSSLIM